MVATLALCPLFAAVCIVASRQGWREVRRAVLDQNGKKRDYCWIVNDLHVSAKSLARWVKEAGEVQHVKDENGNMREVYTISFERALVDFWEDPGDVDRS